MDSERMQITIALAAVFLLAQTVHADTWQLEKGGQLKTVEREDNFASALATLKNLGDEGKTSDLKKTAKDLKSKYPQFASPDFDAFLQAEILYSGGSLEKAYRSYEIFLTKFARSSFRDAAIDRELAIGNSFLEGRKKKVLGLFQIKGYAEGANIMEKIADRLGDEPRAGKAMTSVAQSYEKRERFEEAYQQWSIIYDRWPAGQSAKDALLAMARCKHAVYQGPAYDSTDLISARGYYEKFKQLYPADAAALNIDKRLVMINEQLAYKEFQIGQYYQRTEEPKAGQDTKPADIYYISVLESWPQTKAAKMAAAALQPRVQPDSEVKK
jgi:outer membrane protein assembly factor BamD (BamD/ComL family)